MWFTKLFSSDMEASSKRFIAIILVGVFIIVTFLVLFLKIEVPNQDLVKEQMNNLFWLILIFGGFITAEGILKDKFRLFGGGKKGEEKAPD